MTDNTLSRNQIYESVHRKVGFSRSESAEMVEMVISEISDTLAKGEHVKLTSFGTFAVREKKSRLGRNFKTGEAVRVPSRRSTSFKASQKLINKVTLSLRRKK